MKKVFLVVLMLLLLPALTFASGKEDKAMEPEKSEMKRSSGS